MAKATKKTTVEPVSLIPDSADIRQPRLSKLIIRNFRCIGNKPVEIELDKIVVLVGANNVGKSSILRAYEVAMSQGSKSGMLDIDDFPNRTIDTGHLPEIELHTILYHELNTGAHWINVLPSGEKQVRERWLWKEAGHPIRQGWDNLLNNWSTEEVPWGAPNVANARRPEPHRINAFDSPEEQAKVIQKLLMDGLNERVKSMKSDGEENDYKLLLNQVRDLQKQIVKDAQEQIDGVNKELTVLVSQAFPNYKVDFDARPEDDLDKTITLFKSDSKLLMGPDGGHLTDIERQGSGARRTLLWAALKFISESNQKVNEDGVPVRPHVLLFDEPELCLHPNAIREACRVLYELPETGNWQVMVTTHSPIFIDFSRNNTTIVRVEKNNGGDIEGTTVFRPDKVQLDEEDKRNLKFLNLCDPYVAEFFFGGKTIVVEGDTEYTAFNYIKARKPELYKDVHIIRARGKATIVSLAKVLNHFGSNYAILHDSDTPKTKKGDKANPAWGNNPTILAAVAAKPAGTAVRLLASVPNFEQAYFGETVESEKPYNALVTLRDNPAKFDLVEQLFKSLLDHTCPPPANCHEWTNITDLEALFNDISFADVPLDNLPTQRSN